MNAAMTVLTVGAVFTGMTIPTASSAEIARDDFRVAGDNGLDLFVREVSHGAQASAGKPPVLLLHGARSGVLASFDVDRPEGFSVAADLARAGHRVFLMDARGFGNSDYPPAMDQDRFANAPLVGTDEVVRDIGAVVRALQARTGARRFAMMGWATGSQWLGHYASLHPETVDRLVYYNGIVSAPGSWSLAADLAKPDGAPGEFDAERLGAYRVQTAEDLVGRWEDGKQDPDFVRRYQELSLAGDEAGAGTTPPTFRVPNGALADSLAMSAGRRLWDPSKITAPVLILRSERDFWSRPDDPQHLKAQLVNAAFVRLVTITGASHYVHLEKGPARQRFIDEITRFFAGGDRIVR